MGATSSAFVILHVFDVKTGEELSEAEAFQAGTRTFTYQLDRILTDKDFADTDTTKTVRIGKSLAEDFRARAAQIRAKALMSKGCTKDRCEWCKHCFNKVARTVGLEPLR